MQGFVDYLTRGYSVLQNLAANVVLKIETGDNNAQITFLSVPMPAYSSVTDGFG